jgi:hypothetical protein
MSKIEKFRLMIFALRTLSVALLGVPYCRPAERPDYSSPPSCGTSGSQTNVAEQHEGKRQN